MNEFETKCPECGTIKNKNNSWFECELCGKSIHEHCPECGREFFWNGEIHECQEE